MNKRRSRTSPALDFARESLEARVLLSAVAATHTAIVAHAGTLNQPITFNATVTSSAKAGSPSGKVNIVDNGQVIESVPLTASGAGKSSGTVTLDQPAGGSSYYFGKQKVTATFVPSGSFRSSTIKSTFDVKMPTYTTLANNVKVATIQTGTGPAIQTGETANVMYTGYLESTGQIFDDSSRDGGTPFAFNVGQGQVVPGFDEGVAGMQAGETRIIEMPPSQAYGSQSDGAIPPNSKLIFVVTLAAIS